MPEFDYTPPGVGEVERRPVASWIWGLIVGGLLLAASGLIVHANKVNAELRSILQSQNMLAARTTVHDRLVGERFPIGLLGEFVGVIPIAPEFVGHHLLWILDADRCDRCWADGIAAWNALGNDHELTRHVVWMGRTPVPPEATRAMKDTRISAIPEEQLRTVLGPLLPNTKMLIDNKGIILLVDSRGAGSECGWSFDAQVGALRGVLASELVRN